MPSRKTVHNTHIEGPFRVLHGALVDVTVFMNRPQVDEAMMREAGISLDRALFPLLLGIERFGPIGVVDLADRAGRDHTTVSRQVAKLESAGLVERQADANDRRVRNAVVTAKGKAMTDQVDAARMRIAHALFEGWDTADIEHLSRLMRRFADGIKKVGEPVHSGRAGKVGR